MEWLAVTRCPCRLVSTSSGSTYAEKYARYVEFRLSFSALRLFPELLSLSLYLYLSFFSVHHDIHSSMARAHGSTDPSSRGRRVVSFRCCSVTRILSRLSFSLGGARGAVKSDMCQATVDSTARPLKTGTHPRD